MSNVPADRKYAKSHEWVRKNADGTIDVGITDHAQAALGDLVYVGDVKVGATLQAGDTAGVVESVKAASDIYAPVAGEIIAFNAALEGEPQSINGTPFESWIFKMKPSASLDGLLDAAAYEQHVESSK